MIRENLSLSCARTCTEGERIEEQEGAESSFHGFDRTNNGPPHFSAS